MIGAFYILLNVYVTNYSVLNQTFLGSFDWNYRLQLSSALLLGLTTAMSLGSLLMLLSIAFLTGANLMLAYSNVRNNFRQKSAHFAFGFGALFGTAGSGCASCGLPLLGLLGISGSVGHLPFKGAEVSWIALVLLVFSFFVLLRQNTRACLLKTN